MNQSLRAFLTAASLLVSGVGTFAQPLTLPLEFRQDLIPYNFQSQRGVPISTNVNPVIGSDGRMTNFNETVDSQGTRSLLLPTAKQFQSVVAFGATPGLTAANWLAVSNSAILDAGSTPFSPTVAAEMRLPVGLSNNAIAIVLRRAQVGAPYLSRQVSFPFGSVVAAPVTDENGLPLTSIAPSAYWVAEPHTTNGHANAGYYWSPHAGQVYAIQPGPMTIRWKKAAYTTTPPPDYATNPQNYYVNAGAYFRLFTVNYVVSGSPVKPTRKMYWTERGFRREGKPVMIPAARVGAINIVYNNTTFPRTVDEEYVGVGDSNPTDGTTNAPLPELRTLWYDQQQGALYAYNHEGRVFVELLGDSRPDGQSRQQLGFEIVDVFKSPTPLDVAIDLGERITPPAPGSLDELSPEPVLQPAATPFAYQNTVPGSGNLQLFAIRETFNQNDYFVHWMEAGEVGLKWPALFGRYQLKWPSDVSKYSHYVRPLVATEAEAMATAVPMPTDNVPTIQYQDPLDVPRAKFTPTFGFYTFLEPTFPAHRTLLLFNAGDHIAFERVFSWLDTNLKAVNFVDSVATGLTTLTDYYTRGVNGNWHLFVSDGYPLADGGAIPSWGLVVETTNANTGTISTREFSSSESITINLNETARPYPSILTVSGVTEEVTGIRVKINGYSHTYPDDVDIFLVAPGGKVCALMSDAGGNGAVANVNLVFDDAASAAIPNGSTITSGTYRPGNYSDYPDLTPAGDLVTTLAALLGPQPGVSPIPWLDPSTAPRVVEATVDVGQRINAPAGEAGAIDGTGYLAGYIHQPAGISFNPHAYMDPFAAGFQLANRGSIIPVNAIPGTNALEVWWFRTNRADVTKGFRPIYWPSVIGRYTIQWPVSPREIVLASNKGSEGNGPLDSFEAKGVVYHQNTPGLAGYNPNEEHAIMSGGTLFATRDDLNITSGVGYSSHPFALIEYPDADGRPSMSAFKVLREKPESGWVFDYIVEAGRLLQPPMPLPLLAKPLEGTGDNIINYNTEPTAQTGDLPGDWLESRDGAGAYAHYKRFTYRDRKNDFWVYRGLHSGLPVLRAGTYVSANNSFVALTDATAVAGQPFRFVVHASRQDEFLALTAGVNLPAWLSVSGLGLTGTPTTNHVGVTTVELVVRDLYQGDAATNNLTITVLASGAVVTQAALVLASTNNYTGSIVNFSNRPPFLAQSPAPTNSFTLRYYYKTEPGFAWPGVATPPPAGSIVPYLRPLSAGNFVGDPASKETEALDIVYRPVWPERDPKDSSKPVATMPYGPTLALPQLGLPGIRDWRTAQVLYQQSIGADIASANPSVILHDPTREKVSDLEAQSLDALPPSVNAQIYQGKYYFPNLPPHLAGRVFYDPNRGAKGSLVLAGQFKDEQFGEDYLLLNVLRGTDLEAVRDLCPAADSDNRPKWVALVDALATSLETFHENPDVPGTFVADPNRTISVGITELAEVGNSSVAVDSYALSASGPGSGYVTLVEAGGRPFTQPGDPVALHIIRVVPELHRGELKVLPAANPLSEQVTFQHTPDLAGRFDEYFYEWKIAAPVDGQPPASDATMSRYQSLVSGTNQPMYLLSGSGIQVLGDNWVVLRYKPANPSHPLYDQWSEWTRPQLAEGWIKRVLAGINPFNQRIRDLFNNRVNTDASILSQAGRRWEGDVALNLDTINNYGLIEIYETILRRGRSISIESGFNYGPANDALLLAAGYLNDLYTMIGNEAWADSANPTIGIGTADNTYGEIATALFSFRGQVPSLLEEELALLRGRDDFLVPGVEIAPIYNRMVWNYTRGIDAGEVIYALNYNIQENPNLTPDGVIDASDAAVMFPQGHGDAYGHYLTAVKGYYSLLINNNFDWVPRSEAVLVLGQPVSVDYQDERKFAAAAAALARAGRQVFDLTWRKDYQAVRQAGWQHLAATRVNTQRQFNNAGTPTNSVRYWGLDHWASRSAQGDFLNWVVGNAILPAVDPNPDHEGIQKIDRTTVPELQELALAAEGLQNAMDGAEGGLTPVGLSENAIAFDLNPNVVVGADNGTHFEQVFQRAKVALKNAVASFDDAKDVTRLMRSEQDSLADFQNAVAKQELAYENSLIELYGTPYTDDIGPGKTWKQGYAGPDLVHYMYVDLPEYDFPGLWNYMGATTEFQIDIQDFPSDWADNYSLTDLNAVSWLDEDYAEGEHYITINAGEHGFSAKPSHWTGRRASPGKVQQAISRVIASHTALRQSLFDQAGTKADLDRTIGLFQTRLAEHETIRDYQEDLLIAEQTLEAVQATSDMIDKVFDSIEEDIVFTSDFSSEALPGSFIVGVASGGDLTSVGRAAIEMAGYGIKKAFDVRQIVQFGIVKALEVATSTSKRWVEFEDIAPLEWDQEVRSGLADLGNDLEKVQALLAAINIRLREYDDATRAYRTLLAEGDRIQQERLVFRQRASAVIQGYRTRDAAFRIFRNEKLERYKTLFDLAARYSFLAANAYDYETGLLGNNTGRSFVNRILGARALGVVRDGEPQFAGSNTGDPGLSSALAEMKADWDVVRGRLGFNNPDAYGTTASLRKENFRILPSTNSDPTWRDVLQQHRVPDLLADADVRRHCLQISRGDGLPVPGILIEFSTTIANGYNLFGQQLAAGDHAFSASSFATKIFGVGAALEGYRGMDEPAANGGVGGTSPSDPDLSYLDPLALAATPYVYLIPVGVDSMRSPPLGDASTVRTWSVDDVAIPLPFNIGGSDFATSGMYLSADSLSEPLFNIRKHQSFRPVPDASYFSTSLYGGTGTLQRSQYTNNRLVGRSVWNSRWKLVIPGHLLLNDPNEGLNRFISTVRDIKIHFVTYSYSGN